MPDICRTWCERHNRNAQVQHVSCHCLVVVLLWCENTISYSCHEPIHIIRYVSAYNKNTTFQFFYCS